MRRRLVEVADGVHVATAPRWTTTSTVLVAPDGGCVVVDPALTVAEVEALGAAVHDRGWRPVAGFSTHPHWDHVLWSPALGAVPRWATASAVACARAEHDALVRDAGPGHDPGLVGDLTALDDVTVPGAVRAAPRALPWTGRQVLVLEHGAHAPGAAALLVPYAGVLVAGDLLSDVEVPYLDLGAADPLGDLARALDLLEDLARGHGTAVLVPGHGHVTDGAGLRRRLAADRRYLDALASGAAVDDPRLADPVVRSEHEAQRTHVRG